MPRPATGHIVERRNAAGGINRMLRFKVGGQKRSVALGEVTRADAERRLELELADVERGIWKPPTAQRARQADVPTFHDYADRWWLLNEGQLADSTKADYTWRLEVHLVPHFGAMALDAITFDTVESYIAAKLADKEHPLSPRSINMTLTLLAAILETAVERELITRNPAKGKGRRARERAPKRSYLETAAQVRALLVAAEELDASAKKDKQHVQRRAMIATLTLAGLRIGELCALRWRDIDLGAGWLTVGESKTDAGVRRVKIRGALKRELSRLPTRFAGPDGYVFPTRTAARVLPENFRNRVLAAAVKRANENLEKVKEPPLPEGLTPHSLRRTFCSLLYALGETPPVVMQEMGHADPALALRAYAQAMRLGEQERARMRALMEGEFGHRMDTKGDSESIETPQQDAREAAKRARLRAVS
jgi:integrase